MIPPSSFSRRLRVLMVQLHSPLRPAGRLLVSGSSGRDGLREKLDDLGSLRALLEKLASRAADEAVAGEAQVRDANRISVDLVHVARAINSIFADYTGAGDEPATLIVESLRTAILQALEVEGTVLGANIRTEIGIDFRFEDREDVVHIDASTLRRSIAREPAVVAALLFSDDRDQPPGLIVSLLETVRALEQVLAGELGSRNGLGVRLNAEA